MNTIKVRMIHELKVWPGFFESILDGSKTFELRKDDRDFVEGDVLVLSEYLINEEKYTGRSVRKIITYKMGNGQFSGIEKGWCILGLGAFPDACHVDWK